MGTFHDNLGALHGITVIVDTIGDEVIVGRCHEANDQQVLLLDADVHKAGEQNLTKDQWVKRAAKWGVFAKHKVLKVPRSNVATITPLGQVTPD
jgi:hypothetical protein